MTAIESSSTAQLRWSAMTDQQKIEWLATEVMGWTVYGGSACVSPLRGFTKQLGEGGWNPLSDWNHWREVEEKATKFPGFVSRYERQFSSVIPFDQYLDADLPTRAKALFLAMQ